MLSPVRFTMRISSVCAGSVVAFWAAAILRSVWAAALPGAVASACSSSDCATARAKLSQLDATDSMRHSSRVMAC